LKLMRAAKTQAPFDMRRLRRSELPVDTLKLARYLIGKMLVHDSAKGRMSGRIVETEAYPIGDAAGHAFGGETPSRRSLFLERGRSYVYFTYGSCFMMNVSSERAGIGAGVLLRALEPLEGIALMERHRGTQRLVDLTRGPGRLAKAMDIDKRYDGVDLCAEGPLWLGAPLKRAGSIGVSVRIGITREVHQLYRFYERGNPFVSGLNRMRS
jgi:DNA-3-methyladenine glycosylase